jgi:hypothetical protein
VRCWTRLWNLRRQNLYRPVRPVCDQVRSIGKSRHRKHGTSSSSISSGAWVWGSLLASGSAGGGVTRTALTPVGDDDLDRRSLLAFVAFAISSFFTVSSGCS